MRRLAAGAMVLAISGSMMLAQKVTTPGDFDKAMKTVGTAFGEVNKAIATSAFADAKTHLATTRTSLMSTQSFWTDKKKDDALAMLKDALGKVDALDKVLSAPTVDASKASAAVKEVGGVCQACHKVYREQDPKTKAYSIKAGVL